MPKSMFISALMIGSIASAPMALGETQGTNMTQEEDAVISTIQHMTSNLEKGDIDAVMSTYDAGANILFEPGQPISDGDVARQIFAEMSALKPNVSYPNGDEVYVSGDTAIHIAPWKMTGTAPDGSKVEQGGLSVAVLRRNSEGEWKMVIDNPYSARLMTD